MKVVFLTETCLLLMFSQVNIDCIRLLVKELGHQLEELYLRNCKQIAGSQMIPVIQVSFVLSRSAAFVH